MAIRMGLCVLSALILAGLGCGNGAESTGAPGAVASQGSSASVKIDATQGAVEVKADESGEKHTIEVLGQDTQIEAPPGAADSEPAIDGPGDPAEAATGEDAKLPENLPADLATYPGLVLAYSQTMGQDQFVFGGTTADSLEQVKTFFVSKAQENGWTESMNNVLAEGKVVLLNWTKEERAMSVVIDASQAEGSTKVDVTYAAKQP